MIYKCKKCFTYFVDSNGAVVAAPPPKGTPTIEIVCLSCRLHPPKA
jgi:hypothetical protein